MKSGIIAINKPEGISSARVVARVKKALNVKKVGHTGTLDPFATGLLLCAINQGTRISRFFLGGRKGYLARVTLGIETDTYDLTGKTTFQAPENMMDLSEEEVIETVKAFLGPQDQVPPAFSALKHQGQPLYKLARQGKKILKPPRQIEFYEINIKNIDLPHIDLEVICSAGTYIRSLAFDIGKKLGCGAHLSKLCRTGSSAFRLEDAIDLDVLESLEKITIENKIVSLYDCLSFMPEILANKVIAQKIKFGQKLFPKELEIQLKDPDQYIRMVDEHKNLLALIQLNENMQEYKYCCVFSS